MKWKLRSRPRGRLGGQQGAAMVEMAIIVSLLFTLIFAIIQGGIIFGSWIVVTNAAREGARWGSPCVSRAELPFAASCPGDWSTTTNSQTTIADYTKSRIAWPNPNDATWGPMNVVVQIDNQSEVPRLLSVRVDYSVPLFVPLIGVVMRNPLPLFAQSDMRVEE